MHLEKLKPRERIIFAADIDREDLEQWVKTLAGCVGMFKFGPVLLTEMSPREIVHCFDDWGVDPAQIFIDTKYKDIPSVVGEAVAKLAKMGIGMVTYHLSGQPAMIAEVMKYKGGMLALGVTVLTSMKDDDTQRSYRQSPAKAALRYARDAQEMGSDLIVCAAPDLETILREPGLEGMRTVTPGISLPDKEKNEDQQRVSTPEQAAYLGATFQVIGRAIRDARDPEAVADKIARMIDTGLKRRRAEAS